MQKKKFYPFQRETYGTHLHCLPATTAAGNLPPSTTTSSSSSFRPLLLPFLLLRRVLPAQRVRPPGGGGRRRGRVGEPEWLEVEAEGRPVVRRLPVIGVVQRVAGAVAAAAAAAAAAATDARPQVDPSGFLLLFAGPVGIREEKNGMRRGKWHAAITIREFILLQQTGGSAPSFLWLGVLLTCRQ